jgi:hypothetical protein
MTQVRGRLGRTTRLPLILPCILVVAVLFTACGGGSGAGEAGPAASAPQPAGQNQEPSGDQGQDGESSGNHPGGVFQSTPAARPSCSVTVQAGSTQQPLIRMERLDSGVVCFKGFDQNGPQVHVELTGQSAGTQESADLDAGTDRADGSTAWFWNVTVRTFDTPPGTYQIHATQDSSSGSLEARGQLAVVRATRPRVYAPSTGSSAPGASFPVQLAGFPPGSRAMIFLYGPLMGSRFDFLRALPPARIDAQGESSYSWTSQPDDQAGTYGIWTNPTPSGCANAPCARFSIRS